MPPGTAPICKATFPTTQLLRMPGWRREAMQALARRARLPFRLRRSPARQARLLTSFEKRHMEIPIYFHVSKFKILRSARQGCTSTASVRYQSLQAGRSDRLTHEINGLDADADLFTNTAKADRVVVHVVCCHRDCRMSHEARHGLDVHAAFY